MPYAGYSSMQTRNRDPCAGPSRVCPAAADRWPISRHRVLLHGAFISSSTVPPVCSQHVALTFQVYRAEEQNNIETFADARLFGDLRCAQAPLHTVTRRQRAVHSSHSSIHPFVRPCFRSSVTASARTAATASNLRQHRVRRAINLTAGYLLSSSCAGTCRSKQCEPRIINLSSVSIYNTMLCGVLEWLLSAILIFSPVVVVVVVDVAVVVAAAALLLLLLSSLTFLWFARVKTIPSDVRLQV